MYTYKTEHLSVHIDNSGFISGIIVGGKDILKVPSPIVTLVKDTQLFTPARCEKQGEDLLLFTDAGKVTLTIREKPSHLVLSVSGIDSGVYAVVFGPLSVLMDTTVGDVIGVVQDEDNAFGMMALNRKTVEGVPQKAFRAFREKLSYKEEETGISTGGMLVTERAATRLTGGGSVLHLFCKDRTHTEYLNVCGIENAYVAPLPDGDPDAVINGASVCLFSCARENALNTIGQIELCEGLPHPILDGEWEKTSRRAMKSYLISDFVKEDTDMILDKAQLAGMDTIYHAEPFKTWGHFEWRDEVASSDEDFRLSITQKAKERGMHVGLHTLTNFTTTGDAYVSPVPSKDLVKLARLTLIDDISESDTELSVSASDCLFAAQTLNTLHIGDELIRFSTTEKTPAGCKLTGLTRGAFGTAAAAHTAGEPADLLRDHPYQIFFPEIGLQDKEAGRLVELFNNTGAEQISFDGYEGCSYTGHDLYAPTRFMMTCADGWDHFVLNDGSGLHHFGWHFSTRMNWGEPWGEAMRTGQVESRMRNQDFYRRNLFPRMLGWFLIRLSERKFEATNREDIEWAMSEAAGFDAGFSITVKPGVLRRHGRVDELLTQIRYWDELRYALAFTEEQRERLRKPENEFRLEKTADGEFDLIPISITKPYTCSLSEMQPGQKGGADWVADNPLNASFAFRLYVDGDGAITNPIFTTAGGTVRFPCTVSAGQYLLFDLDGRCEVTDRNLNTLQKVTPVGSAALPHGSSSFSFCCDHNRDEEPDVSVRLICRGSAEHVSIRQK